MIITDTPLTILNPSQEKQKYFHLQWLEHWRHSFYNPINYSRSMYPVNYLPKAQITTAQGVQSHCKTFFCSSHFGLRHLHITARKRTTKWTFVFRVKKLSWHLSVTTLLASKRHHITELKTILSWNQPPISVIGKDSFADGESKYYIRSKILLLLHEVTSRINISEALERWKKLLALSQKRNLVHVVHDQWCIENGLYIQTYFSDYFLCIIQAFW
jgi:hypothetical protein